MVQLAQWGKQQRWAGPLRWCLAVVLVVALAYVLANTVWLLWYGPSDPVSTDSLTHLESRGTGKASGPVLSQAQVDSWQLFGEYQAAPSQTDQPTDAPDTRLRLVLLGVFQTANTEQATAIIAEKGQEGEVYHVGDSIPGNATLEEVYADRVILRRAGRLETLRWSEAALGGVQAVSQEPRRPEAAATRSADSDGEPDLRRQRKAIVRQLGLEPVSQGGNQGYQLGQRAPKQLLSQVGLKPDDVIVSVNGHALGTESNDLAALRSYQQTQQATIVVKRGNQQFTVNYPP